MRPSFLASPLLLLPLVASASEPSDLVDPLDTPQGAIPIDGGLMPAAATKDADAGLPEGTKLPTKRLGDKILFVNFDGQDMNSCFNNNPQQNCSTIFGGTVLPYSGDASQRAAVIQTVRKKVEDFGMTVTDQRPSGGDYDMEMVGNWQNSSPSFAGVAPSIDCFDQNGGEVSFTLEASGSADGMAEIILQELAHTWGLEHIDDQTDLLFPTTQGQNKVFKDECLKIVSDTDLNETNGQCNSMHTNFCNFGWQNSHAEMLALFGPGIPDTEPPFLAIASPTEGQQIDGGDLELVVQIDDNEIPAVINLRIDMVSDALDEPVEFSGAWASPNEVGFPIQGLPDGTYTITVEADDESDNPAMDQVTFTIIGSDTPPAADGGNADADSGADGSGGGADGGDGGGGTDGGGDGGSDGADGTGDAGALDGGSSDDGGCGCHTPTPAKTAWLLWLVPVLVVRRRC